MLELYLHGDYEFKNLAKNQESIPWNWTGFMEFIIEYEYLILFVNCDLLIEGISLFTPIHSHLHRAWQEAKVNSNWWKLPSTSEENSKILVML